MDDIDPDKALAALEQLEAEKARPLQAKIDSGELVEIETVVVIGRDDNIADAKARALARRPVPDDGRAFPRVRLHYYGRPTGRHGSGGTISASTTASPEGPSHPSEEPARSGPPFSRSEPTYVRVTIRNGDDDGDPGAIAEAYYTIEDGVVVLRDHDDKHLTSRALLKGEDPAVIGKKTVTRNRGGRERAFIARLATRTRGIA